ncbi:DUF3370 domain-containing protein [[Limnothrix rosea] IAM M-220]|uniref:DUF3370 domain-containing protein n=1 Tax=[Limnothrix rosea] IAM M-220 TaxID=454133 RepID=UPI001F276230
MSSTASEDTSVIAQSAGRLPKENEEAKESPDPDNTAEISEIEEAETIEELEEFLELDRDIPAFEPELPKILVDYQSVLPLPGELNQVPVFNSNSPEIITQEGILLSTFPKSTKRYPHAHLEAALEGRFDIFTHHISRPAGTPKTLYQGLIVNNPTGKRRSIRILQGLSYLNSQDAPFRELPPFIEDPNGHVFSGPGSRLVGDLLRGKNQEIFPELVSVPPYSTKILFSLPIPPSSSRSTYLQLESDGGLYLANLAKYEVTDFIEREVVDEEAWDRIQEERRQKPVETELEGLESDSKGFEIDFGRGEADESLFRIPTKIIRESFVRSPSLDEWRTLLTTGKLVEPRDLAPIPNPSSNQVIYGRVAGVSVGSQWHTTVTNLDKNKFIIPDVGKAVSFPISTTSTGTFNTEQVHSAPMLVRYPDTAWEGHGNYLVHYDLQFPLHNATDETQKVSLIFQTPIKQNQFSDRLTFFETPPDRVFYRGTVRVRYPDMWGDEVTDYYHLVQRRGERGQPLVTLDIPPNQTMDARVDFFYPPDATPPQVITVKTLDVGSETD